MKLELRIPVSPDQEDAIIDHLFEGKELGMVADERAWMIAQAQKIHPGAQIRGADLNIGDVSWTLTLEK